MGRVFCIYVKIRPVWRSLSRCDKVRKEHLITFATKYDGENAVGSHCVGNISSCKPQHGCEPSLSAPIPYLPLAIALYRSFKCPGLYITLHGRISEGSARLLLLVVAHCRSCGSKVQLGMALGSY
jgi:hypothetical protein